VVLLPLLPLMLSVVLPLLLPMALSVQQQQKLQMVQMHTLIHYFPFA
jgi:hypothetical protein